MVPPEPSKPSMTMNMRLYNPMAGKPQGWVQRATLTGSELSGGFMRRSEHADTRTISDGDVLPVETDPQAVTALVLVWSREEPERMGEVCLVPGGYYGVTVRMGRAPGAAGDILPRAEFCRQRPGMMVPTGPLNSMRISRDQLEISAERTGLWVRNIGRCPLLHNGNPVQEATIRTGDLLELKGQALIYCAQRPATLPAFAPGIPAPAPHRFGYADGLGMVGESLASWALRERIQFVGPRAVHVLIRGGSGTGKELVAQAIHQLSSRGRKQMISRNAATIPESLIDAELFGNARNYPNPGMAERAGLVGEADGSTLFLDEFAEIPPAMQAHLLRVLDQGEYHRLGESKPRRADFRLIAATNRPESALKEDVLARLRIRLELPDLNQRREDIPLLVRHILKRIVAEDSQLSARCFFPDGTLRVSPTLMSALLTRQWSTHIRELEAILWTAISDSRGDWLEVQLPQPPVSPTTVEADGPHKGVDPLTVPAEHIQAVLDKHGGRQEPTWKELGFSSRHVLTRLVRRYGLRVKGRTGEDED